MNNLSEKIQNRKSKLIFLLVIILGILFVVLGYFVYSILNKLEIREYFKLPKIKSESYLDVSFSYPDFTNSSSSFTFPLYIENKHQSNISLSINSELYFSTSDKRKVIIDKFDSSDIITSGSKKRYDISFKRIFDNSIISGLNFCNSEKSLINLYPKECYKGESYTGKICWEDCKLYSLDFSAGKSLYCYENPKVSTIISYDTKISGIVEIQTNSLEDRIRWSVSKAPIRIYVRPSPLPYNNLLPLDLGLELEGEDVFVRKISIKLINYSLEVETFFEKRIETIKSEQECLLEVNKWINGKLYLSKENGFGCVFQPFEIEIKRFVGGKSTSQILNVQNDSKNIIESVCGKVSNENLEDCAKKLRDKGYSICSVYSDLGICKYESERLDKVILLIEADISTQEKYERGLSLKEC
ncbi:MAG: hypothetical protein QW409_03090 [Candidatus Aenigmatarchaeota archaeon]